MNGVHDLGGSHGHGPVVAEPGETVFHRPWEGRVYAMMSLCRQRGLFNLDEMRNAIEHMPPAEYLASSYYERWLSALERLISEKEATGPSGLNPKRPAPDLLPRWKSGDHVRTRNLNPSGHTRLPRYARARQGQVESVSGPYLLPDLNAHLRGHLWEPVYTVVFTAAELWGEQAGARESVSLDLWEAYLEDD